ncbi:hypothetical protein JANAI62_19990 [Jannaschia pagri]|uniref:Transcriptional regulator, PaaX family n=1 Tax=Jannaschia pagri TaxID=2829797 RepID=A0ABQ4NLT9_9RHOB|nr:MULTISPECIES: PaaX family transcriptional regulator C-terminal domain-containing protein [unclassified Jannaschia]GIT91542.1 hypothetical protein JANAI61_20000 [Jannaschia sp. AI_61]GIT95376.1 hypothetical protein JANAI62_19990 [Jannaschia sp. AI_62]
MDDFDRLIAHLRDGQTHRTWSVLVTVFGDLARVPGQEVGSPLLSRLCAPIGIRPEALRVALHRLRKDNWVSARRAGRHSLYVLTEEGLRQSRAASPKIYGVHGGSRAYLVLRDDGGAVLAPTPPTNEWSVPLSTAPPDWLRAQTCREGTAELAADTRRRFAALQAELAKTPVLEPIQIAALRILVVHTWRRVALRLPDLPDFALPGGDDIRQARGLFQTLLARLPAPAVDTL